ncbi:macro domain-containing protein [Bacillus thuringiensis]|uniref:macro domain-containing protein n=1 Tax=Bacillus thuringiensis TaxID=1428 RepID=UPI000BF35CC6|nr:macro domain-containing protein [Bacillus thuringiensis]PFL00150.1 Appr-1-p processing protein [Bacillus thuringiensis]PGH90536.1 Appr-1-p processing protein [Bacillus thuringiensis]PGU39702.1 Appr-1-p processing protein [Bacillus thuringiensis]
MRNGNITNYDTEVDVIVNAWNRNFLPRYLLNEASVSKEIRKKAGHEPFKQLKKEGILKLGEAVITSSGFLNCKALMHVAGINALWKATEYSIRQSTYNALQLVIKKKYSSVALPIIGSGIGGLKKEKCLAFIKEECKKFIHHEVDVYIIDFCAS